MAEAIPSVTEHLRIVADELALPFDLNLGDDAVIYAGSAVAEQWQSHVPQIVVSLWPHMTEQARLVAFVSAMSAMGNR